MACLFLVLEDCFALFAEAEFFAGNLLDSLRLVPQVVDYRAKLDAFRILARIFFLEFVKSGILLNVLPVGRPYQKEGKDEDDRQKQVEEKRQDSLFSVIHVPC